MFYSFLHLCYAKHWRWMSKEIHHFVFLDLYIGWLIRGLIVHKQLKILTWTFLVTVSSPLSTIEVWWHQVPGVWEFLCGCDQEKVSSEGKRTQGRCGQYSKGQSVHTGKRKQSETKRNKSAITDYVCQTNHLIDWDSARMGEREWLDWQGYLRKR